MPFTCSVVLLYNVLVNVILPINICELHQMHVCLCGSSGGFLHLYFPSLKDFVFLYFPHLNGGPEDVARRTDCKAH